MTKREKQLILIKLRNIKKSISSKLFSQTPPINEVQQKAFSTIRKLILKPNSILWVAPISGTCYIEYKNYFVKFNLTYATITNSKFSYYIEFDYRHGENLINFFNKRVEKRRQALEDTYNIKTVKNLEEILKTI